jgi:hypothetical protein
MMEETVDGPAFVEELRLDQLDGDHRIGDRLAGQHDLAHAALAEDFDDLVFADHAEHARRLRRQHHARLEQVGAVAIHAGGNGRHAVGGHGFIGEVGVGRVVVHGLLLVLKIEVTIQVES